LNAEVYDDDVLYKLSTYVEPRGGGEPSGERPPQLRDTEVPKAKHLSIFFLYLEDHHLLIYGFLTRRCSG